MLVSSTNEVFKNAFKTGEKHEFLKKLNIGLFIAEF
jgi:hypothetical protein